MISLPFLIYFNSLHSCPIHHFNSWSNFCPREGDFHIELFYFSIYLSYLIIFDCLKYWYSESVTVSPMRTLDAPIRGTYLFNYSCLLLKRAGPCLIWSKVLVFHYCRFNYLLNIFFFEFAAAVPSTSEIKPPFFA